MRPTSSPDLLLINPGGRTNIYQALASKLAAIEPPIWAGLIASYIRKKGFSVAILDANAEDICPDEVADRVKAISPLLTAVVAYGHNPSASTQVMPSAGAICTAIKDNGSQSSIILLGGHVAALPEQTLREEIADYVCDGEGPVTILELLQHLHGRGQSLDSVRGLLYREGDDVVHTSPAPLITALDNEMPGIAWDLFPMGRYRAHNWHCFDGMERQPYAALYTSLGCPCRCSFCCIQAPFKSGEAVSGYNKNINSYRLWNPESVIVEIDILVQNYGIRNIKFADELFVLNPEHVNGICDLIISRGYDLNIWAYSRVDTLKETMLEKLKRAGVTWLALGIESASDRVRDDASKGFAHDRIFNTVQAIRRVDINIGANYIFGLPEDDLESMQATLDLALALNTEWANFNCAMAYPGSQLYEQALHEGWQLPEDWSGYSQYSFNSLPLRTRHLSASEVLRFRDEAFHTYFSNPEYLKLIQDKFGDAAVDHVQEMTHHRLKRKYS
ncbi:MAG: radical SAM protein [Deltaproteobacteria bacterium]|nr:radical SAM protein [Deltaproteobacteria bacterium]